MSESAKTFANFEQFWPHYLRQHTRYGNRLLHLMGNVSGLSITVAALVTGRWWWLIVARVVGYAFAWIGHVVIERNRPATLGHPLWSARASNRMLWLAVTRRLRDELRRNGL